MLHTYRYPFASHVDEPAAAATVATSLEGTSEDLFFEGRPRSPAAVGRKLLCVAEVVRTRYYMRMNPALLDPVVTGGGGKLRFEGFSSCNGVYARADLDAAAFDCDLRGRGTTNVDFNDPMRTALSRVRDSDAMTLRVGGTGVELDAAEGTVTERKVKLPTRWLKGFCEVQAYQPRLVEMAFLPADALRSLLRMIPKTRHSFLTKTGRSWRWAARGTGVAVGGAERLKPFEPLLRDAVGPVRVLADEESGVSAWELPTETGRLTLVLSPAADRGFSGEGQALGKLAGGVGEDAIEAVASAMRWWRGRGRGRGRASRFAVRVGRGVRIGGSRCAGRRRLRRPRRSVLPSRSAVRPLGGRRHAAAAGQCAGFGGRRAGDPK